MFSKSRSVRVITISNLLPNAPRFCPGQPHVESWFWRANHPDRPLAFWLKATIIAHEDGRVDSTIWCSLFDAEKERYWGGRATTPYDASQFAGSPLRIETTTGHFELGAEAGQSQGRLSNADGCCEWRLTWSPEPGPLGSPLSIFPYDWMLNASFPRSKTLTPHPALRFSGQIIWDGVPWELAQWPGMQGHNWGKEHTPRYAWGQCWFEPPDEMPCMVEGFSGCIRVAGRLTPPFSALVIRRGDETFMFNGMVDLWNQKAEMDYPKWTLSMRSKQASAKLVMTAKPDEMVCLGYDNPDGQRSYCLNSKIAEVELTVTPTKGNPFSYRSLHGGALEFLLPNNPGFDTVV